MRKLVARRRGQPGWRVAGETWMLAGVLLLAACGRDIRNRSHPNVSLASIREGEKLAAVYCQSCHLLPSPGLADTKSWEKGILPGMGPRLGIFQHNFELYPSSRRDTNVPKGFYPSQPLLKPEEWQHILDYYTATAPDSLPGQSRPRPIEKGLPLFEADTPRWRYPMPATTFVKIDTASPVRGLLAYDIHYHELYRVSPSLQLLDTLPESGGIVDMIPQGEGWTTCDIGVLRPNNGRSGRLKAIAPGWKADSVPLFDRLQRPVQVVGADLNQDGKTDYLLCEFGNLTGALSWLENKGNGQYERHVIRAAPGAIRAYVGDYNHDGLPDIMALFAQGDEGIYMFTNTGGGRFSERSVLRFPPSYGSSYFELDDFDHDGNPDILYTCGDNADYSPVLKPYHGVYIFLNNGQYHFDQRYFFPIHGCYKAIARDFDGDGDLDIATIAFFPDFDQQPEEGFVYLENRGQLDFIPYSLAATQRGKWLTMDAGDIDGDGRPDLVLGNFSYYSPVTRGGVDFKKGPPFMVLRNRGVSAGRH